MAASTTTNCMKIDSVMFLLPGGAVLPQTSLLELGRDQVLEREDLVPFLLREELPFLHYDGVQALARLVALSGSLRALLVDYRLFGIGACVVWPRISQMRWVMRRAGNRLYLLEAEK